MTESTKSQCLQKMTEVEAGVKAFQPSNISYHMILKVLRTCVPGKSSLALLIIMLVHEDLRSSAIVSPPFPMMWPETLLKNEIQRSRSDQILHSTLHSTSVSEEPQRFFPQDQHVGNKHLGINIFKWMSLPPPRCLFALLPFSVSLSMFEYCIALNFNFEGLLNLNEKK